MPDTTPPLRETLISRQPILDLKQELIGYALRFRKAGRREDEADGNDVGTVQAAFAGLGLDVALGRHLTVVGAYERFLMDDAADRLPTGIALELDFAAAPTAALIARCRALRARGHLLVLPSREQPALRESLLPLLDIVKVDASLAPERLAASIAPLAAHPLRILAEGVASREQMEACRDAGCHLFQGFYFARPRLVSGRQLSSSQLGIIRLLNQVAREADAQEVEEGFKREPGLSVDLLRLVNAVGIGAAQKIDSLRRAIAILGRKQLLRWLQLLLMAAPHSGSLERNPLLQVAAQRGALMERLAARRVPGDPVLAEEAFLVGIMSLMPAALGLPLAEILAQIPVVDAVHRALATREGELGRLFDLAESLDDGDWARCDRLLDDLPPLSREAVSASLCDVLAWIHRDGEN